MSYICDRCGKNKKLKAYKSKSKIYYYCDECFDEVMGGINDRIFD